MAKGRQNLRAAACWLWEEQGEQKLGRGLAFTKGRSSKEGWRERRAIPASNVVWEVPEKGLCGQLEMQGWGVDEEGLGVQKRDTMGETKRDGLEGREESQGVLLALH